MAKKPETNKPAGKPSAPPAETKAGKFVRLATARTTKAIKAIGQLNALSGSSYESTPEQREKIITALRNAIDAVETRFAGHVEKAPEFTL